jgi:hypothetical protein
LDAGGSAAKAEKWKRVKAARRRRVFRMVVDGIVTAAGRKM